MANAAVVEEQQVEQGGQGSAGGQGSVSGGWKDSLPADVKGAPVLSSYDNTPEGLSKAMTGYLNLEKLLGHEKVPIPKDANDTEGWNRYSKAMGIPEKSDDYGLADAKIPENLSKSGLQFDKKEFAEVMHTHKVHPSAVKGLWEVFQQKNIQMYTKAVEAQKETVNKAINALKGEWGDSYQMNVELGQTVINKFSADQDSNDWVTAVLSTDPRGIKFLSKIGEQFAENKVPEFQMKRFSLAPAEAAEEVSRMKQDFNGPYWNHGNKFTKQEQDAAIARVNMLLAKAQGK